MISAVSCSKIVYWYVIKILPGGETINYYKNTITHCTSLLLKLYYTVCYSVSKQEKCETLFKKKVNMCLELHNRTETTSGLPPAFLHDVNGPVDGARRPADIPVPHFEVAILHRGGQIHTVSR